MEKEIKKHLLHYAKDVSFEIYDTIDSTNNRAKQLAKDGGKANTVIIARSQTSGRGRLGKSFYSPCDTGIYMSILLRPDAPASSAILLTTAASVAVAKAIEKLSGKQAQIKWINDIYINKKKVAGILTEAAFSPNTASIEYAVVGIGVNLYPPKNLFPDDIKEIATSVFDRTDTPADDLSALFCAQIINNLLYYADTLNEKSFLNDYRERLFMLGQKIRVIEGSKSYEATALDIDDECHLIVLLDDGSRRTLSSGEISTKLI